MKRGDILIFAGRGDYVRKPRPALVVQSDRFAGTDSLAIVPFTTTPVDADILRLRVEPSDVNGLSQESFLMIDKVLSIKRSYVRQVIGHLSTDDLTLASAALATFLGFAR
ncbi:MAG: type II toxin-antitoxin system PemK/MazF family toxin [Pacificimonas sp.]|nr:type II toxin-antitoxin system PemK/MazF family toxin [Pacificimonas sp.]